jgi:hypothetical protein
LERDGTALGSKGALAKDEAQKLVDHFASFSVDTAAGVQVVERDRLLEILQLQERLIDDEMRIVLASKPVDELSPGQRSSAMLPLIALSETAPLVIDQPEDNLDQRMVGKTLTKILADLKETRQIVVTTHNANIVVGGDAEQGRRPRTRGCSLVQGRAHREHRRLRDHRSRSRDHRGGREAFRTRHRRYHLDDEPSALAP